jgi:hypothetical protein
MVPLAVLAALTVFATGCTDNHVGRVCDLDTGGGDAGTGVGNTATLNVPALECPSRICLLPANETGADTGPTCTAECGSDDDCKDSEHRNTSNPTDLRCKLGFKCLIPTTVGDLCCRRMCICKDFISDPNIPFMKPTECDKSNPTVTCKNAF